METRTENLKDPDQSVNGAAESNLYNSHGDLKKLYR